MPSPRFPCKPQHTAAGQTALRAVSAGFARWPGSAGRPAAAPFPPRTSPPRWAETFSLPANLAFGVSQKPKLPLCKGRRREAPEGSFWDRLQLFQNDGSVTAPPTQGSLREPFRICHNRLFQYAKTPGHWTGGLLALWLPCGEGQGGRS